MNNFIWIVKFKHTNKNGQDVGGWHVSYHNSFAECIKYTLDIEKSSKSFDSYHLVIEHRLINRNDSEYFDDRDEREERMVDRLIY